MDERDTYALLWVVFMCVALVWVVYGVDR